MPSFLVAAQPENAAASEALDRRMKEQWHGKKLFPTGLWLVDYPSTAENMRIELGRSGNGDTPVVIVEIGTSADTSAQYCVEGGGTRLDAIRRRPPNRVLPTD